MTKKLFLLGLLAAFTLSGCSPSIVGTWTVQKYEKTSINSDGFSLNNIGTISFGRNGTGEKDIFYELFNMERELNIPFTWKGLNDYISIESEDDEFSKIWIITKATRNLYELKSTDGATQVQVLELKKKKE